MAQIYRQRYAYLLEVSLKINELSGAKNSYGNNITLEYLSSIFLGTSFGNPSSKGSELPGFIWGYGGADIVQRGIPKNILTKTAFRGIDIYLNSIDAGTGSDRVSNVRANAVNYFKTSTINYINPATLFNINTHTF